MGWTGDNELWVSTRGGDVLVAPQPGVTEKFENAKVPSRGFGILDVGCAPSRESALFARDRQTLLLIISIFIFFNSNTRLRHPRRRVRTFTRTFMGVSMFGKSRHVGSWHLAALHCQPTT